MKIWAQKEHIKFINLIYGLRYMKSKPRVTVEIDYQTEIPQITDQIFKFRLYPNTYHAKFYLWLNYRLKWWRNHRGIFREFFLNWNIIQLRIIQFFFLTSTFGQVNKNDHSAQFTMEIEKEEKKPQYFEVHRD